MGNRNAWKHGRRSRENIELRRQVADILGEMRANIT